MTTPITPPFEADEVLLETIQIRYRPEWDGSAWVIDPSNINLLSTGSLVGLDVKVSPATVTTPWADLPAGAQNAIQQLYPFIENLMAGRYTP